MSNEFTEFMDSTTKMTFTHRELDLIRRTLEDRGFDFEADGNADAGEPYYELATRIAKELVFEE